MNGNAPVPKVGIVSSSGMPLSLVRSLRFIYGQYDHAYYLTESVVPADDMVGRMEVLGRSSCLSGAWRQFLQSWKLFGVQRPSLILTVFSSGSLPILMACVGRKIPVLLIHVPGMGCTAWLVRRLPQLIALWILSVQGNEPLGDQQTDTVSQQQRQAEAYLRLCTSDLARTLHHTVSPSGRS